MVFFFIIVTFFLKKNDIIMKKNAIFHFFLNTNKKIGKNIYILLFQTFFSIFFLNYIKKRKVKAGYLLSKKLGFISCLFKIWPKNL
jgi:hypothetical protein